MKSGFYFRTLKEIIATSSASVKTVEPYHNDERDVIYRDELRILLIPG
jgi:hypothetical protein